MFIEKLWSAAMRYLARNTFNVFSKDDILTDWKWRGNKLDDETIAKLKEEARTLRGSLLWNILKSEAQWVALKAHIEHGVGERDLGFTRQVGYVVKVFDDKLNDMAL